MADEDRLVIVSDIDESLGVLIPEVQAVFSSFVSFDPEPTTFEL
jgi:hypothetical protein